MTYALHMNIEAQKQRIRAALLAGMEDFGAAIVQTTEDETPVVTGNLVGALDHEISQSGSILRLRVGFIRYYVRYDIYVEKGTSRMAGRFMLTRAVDLHTPHFWDYVRVHV